LHVAYGEDLAALLAGLKAWPKAADLRRKQHATPGEANEDVSVSVRVFGVSASFG